MSREKTDRLLELIEEGVLHESTVLMACLKYMSEAEVSEMARLNEIYLDEEVPE